MTWLLLFLEPKDLALLEVAPSVIVAIIALCVTILLALVKVIFSMGQVMNKVNNIEAEVREIAKDLGGHITNASLHVNKELQDAMITGNIRFQDQTQSKMNEMAKDLRDLLLGRKQQ